MPPRVQSVGLPTLEPSGGLIPETTADAENNKTTKEEAEVPVSSFYRSQILHVIDWLPRRQARGKAERLRGEGKFRPGRIVEQDDKGKLCGLVKRWKSLEAEPSTAVALEGRYTPCELKSTHLTTRFNVAMVEYIPTIRTAMYPEPRLEAGATRPCPTTARAKRQWERRRQERELFERLSQFYELPGNGSLERRRGRGKKGEENWTVPPLLKEGKRSAITDSIDDLPLILTPISFEGPGGSAPSPRAFRSLGFDSDSGGTVTVERIPGQLFKSSHHIFWRSSHIFLHYSWAVQRV